MTGYLLLFWVCLTSGLLIPAPEDLALVVAGVQVSDGVLELLPTIAVASVAILLRDALFFGVGRVLGEKVLERPLVRRVVGDDAIARARGLVERRGSLAVLAARAMLGFRTAGFLVAGAMGVRRSAFLLWDCIGLALSVPLVLGLGMVLGDQATVGIAWMADHGALFGIALFALGLGWLAYTRREAQAVGATAE